MKHFKDAYYVEEDGSVYSTKYGSLKKLKGRVNIHGYVMYVYLLMVGLVTSQLTTYLIMLMLNLLIIPMGFKYTILMEIS